MQEYETAMKTIDIADARKIVEEARAKAKTDAENIAKQEPGDKDGE